MHWNGGIAGLPVVRWCWPPRYSCGHRSLRARRLTACRAPPRWRVRGARSRVKATLRLRFAPALTRLRAPLGSRAGGARKEGWPLLGLRRRGGSERGGWRHRGGRPHHRSCSGRRSSPLSRASLGELIGTSPARGRACSSWFGPAARRSETPERAASPAARPPDLPSLYARRPWCPCLCAIPCRPGGAPLRWFPCLRSSNPERDALLPVKPPPADAADQMPPIAACRRAGSKNRDPSKGWRCCSMPKSACRSLRITATKATFFGLPRATSSS